MTALCSYFSHYSGPHRGAGDRIEQVHARDDVRFKCLVERYQQEIFAFTHALTGDEQEADILAQRIFVRAYEDSPPPDASMAISTWLYRLALEEFVLQSRVNGLRRVLQAFPAALVARSLPTNEQSAIRKGLRTLSAKAMALLVLREVAHQSVPELAQIAGCDVLEIRAQLLNARRALSTALRQVDSGGV